MNIVESRGKFFGKPTRVHEHDRRTIILDIVHDAFLNIRPNRGTIPGCALALTARLPCPCTRCRARGTILFGGVVRLLKR